MYTITHKRMDRINCQRVYFYTANKQHLINLENGCGLVRSNETWLVSSQILLGKIAGFTLGHFCLEITVPRFQQIYFVLRLFLITKMNFEQLLFISSSV